MRYHKAKTISELEATYIIGHGATSLNAVVVVEHYGQWFDVRRMTDVELDEFVLDLGRERAAALASGLLVPH